MLKSMQFVNAILRISTFTFSCCIDYHNYDVSIVIVPFLKIELIRILEYFVNIIFAGDIFLDYLFEDRRDFLPSHNLITKR